MRIHLLAWTVEVDLGKTERIYREVEVGAADRCGCPACKNFSAARRDHLPGALVEVLVSLGVAPDKETTVRLVSPLEGEMNLYAGTYVFCGAMLAGRPYRGFPFLTEQVDVFERIAPNAHLALRPWKRPAGPWLGCSCVQLEFLVVLPWILGAKKPPSVNRRQER